LCPREIWVCDHVDDPRGLAARPHPARKPFPTSECHPLAQRSELAHVGFGGLPDREALETPARRNLPHSPEVPAERRPDLGEDSPIGLFGIGRLSERVGDGEYDARRGRLPSLAASQVSHAGHFSLSLALRPSLSKDPTILEIKRVKSPARLGEMEIHTSGRGRLERDQDFAFDYFIRRNHLVLSTNIIGEPESCQLVCSKSARRIDVECDPVLIQIDPSKEEPVSKLSSRFNHLDRVPHDDRA
jgi:hypothetical protein